MLDLSHKKLDVWKLIMELVREVYGLTKDYPKEEMYNLVSQMRRASISVASNFVEGAARISKTEKRRFFEVSRSSLVELDTQVEASKVLGYLDDEKLKPLTPLVQSVFRILSKLIDNNSK